MINIYHTYHKYNNQSPPSHLTVGYDISKIREFDTAKPFFRHIFIIKPQILLEISKLMVKTMNKVKRLSLQKHIKYNNDYLHPFIFGRLPAFFLYTMNNINVCINKTTGPCVANTEFFHYEGDTIVVDKV